MQIVTIQKRFEAFERDSKVLLTVDSKQYLSIAAFGSKKGRPKQCEVVRLIVRSKLGGCQELEVFVVPHICDPVTSPASVACSNLVAVKNSKSLWYLTFVTQ